MSTPHSPDGTAELVEHCRVLSRQIRSDIADAVSGARSTVGSTPLLGSSIVATLETAAGEINAALDEIQQNIDSPGIPRDLRSAGATWAGPILSTLSSLQSEFTADRLTAAQSWKGAAADAYRLTLLPQANAFDNLKAGCAELNTAFNQLADAVSAYWVAMVVALVGLAAALIALVYAVASAGAALVPAVGTFLFGFSLFIGGLITAKTGLSAAVNSTKTVLQNRLGNGPGLPDGGHWPMSTKISSDATFADGSSNWQLVD